MAVFCQGQDKFLTKQGYASFFSSTPVEDIKGENNQVLSIVDTKNGKMAIAILMKSFMFEKSLMQEHFNENYVESSIYPKATFKGTILNFDSLIMGENKILVKGDITIHGVTKTIEIEALLTKSKENISVKGTFPVVLEDFNIKIPSVVTNNISKTVEVAFDFDHQPYIK